MSSGPEDKEALRESGQWFGITLSLWLVIALALATGATILFFRFEQSELAAQIESLRTRVETLEADRLPTAPRADDAGGG